MKRKRKIDMVKAFNVVVDNRISNSLSHVIDQKVTTDLSIRVSGDRRNKPLTVARSIMPVIMNEILNIKIRRKENE